MRQDRGVWKGGLLEAEKNDDVIILGMCSLLDGGVSISGGGWLGAWESEEWSV